MVSFRIVDGNRHYKDNHKNDIQSTGNPLFRQWIVHQCGMLTVYDYFRCSKSRG